MSAGFLTAADEAERIVADVRDDAEARIRLAADTYAFGRWRHRYSPYRRAVVAFMRWQQRRGVLNAPGNDIPGSPWWRAVNEALLRETVEAKLLVLRGGGIPSRPSVARWIGKPHHTTTGSVSPSAIQSRAVVCSPSAIP